MKTTSPQPTVEKYSPLWQIVLSRVREFYREPEALFWVYGFPVLLVVGLGVAFRNQPVEVISVDVEAGPAATTVVEMLAGKPRFKAAAYATDVARLRLRTGKTDLVVVATAGSPPRYEYVFDPTRPPSVLARNAVDDALQRAAGRQDVAVVSEQEFNEPGGRYIDFLVPGLLGMSLMGGGMWGVGFVTVDMRIRKLLKRFLATPMRKSDFLSGIMLSRMLFMVPEVLVLLVFARLAFDVRIFGSLLAVLFLVLLGAVTFCGLGLLLAARPRTLEAISGLMNLVMLPMWLLSGIFFSSDRFPEMFQPFIKLLPLTALIDSLRAVMQDGASLTALWSPIAIMAAWSVVSFAAALRWFRWV
ncbi:MAG: ABC transporter permease [Pirellulales bacterium]